MKIPCSALVVSRERERADQAGQVPSEVQMTSIADDSDKSDTTSPQTGVIWVELSEKVRVCPLS